MAQSDRPPREPASPVENGNNSQSLWRRLLFRRDSPPSGLPDASAKEQGSQSDDDPPKPGLIRRVSRKVVPGLPRAQTFKRQQSEVRNKLEPVQPTPAERRAVSVDRRVQSSHNGSQTRSNPRSSAPDFTNHSLSAVAFVPSVPSLPVASIQEKMPDGIDQLYHPLDVPDLDHGIDDGVPHVADAISMTDCQSMTTSQYDALIHEELERMWILNLSMHFRDKSKREKFFVTYRERDTLWRRVTISVDYRNAAENSLELELAHIKFQRDKIAKIYDAIRESLADIQFYPTVTNLKLQTTEGRLHVHVVEDVNEIIHYPSVRTIQHMRCNRVKERDIEFDSHISGFVYKVKVNDEILIKKEIPSPDTVDEFLYEINALNRLKYSNHVIKFYGVIVDDNDDHIKGLLISYAEQGALIDIIYDQVHPLPWSTREQWAKQIVSGLSEIHEAGFVQGDFTLSNIVIDDDDNAKIIDINRRGCPVGWEPPEATPLIESNQRISMYIGVKSDLYQLGMVLWALAMKEDEPEAHGRPLRIGSDVLDVPNWYRRVVDICLSEDPRGRIQALHLLSLFPDREAESDAEGMYDRPSISVDDGVTRQEYFVDAQPSTNGYPRVRTVHPASDWSYVGWGHAYMNSPNGLSDEPYFYPTRGRSPPSPLPSNPGEYEASKYGNGTAAWSSAYGSGQNAPSESVEGQQTMEEGGRKSVTPRTSKDSMAAPKEINESELPEQVEHVTVIGSTKETRGSDEDVTAKADVLLGVVATPDEPSPSPGTDTLQGVNENNVAKANDDVELVAPQGMHPAFENQRDMGKTEPELPADSSSEAHVQPEVMSHARASDKASMLERPSDAVASVEQNRRPMNDGNTSESMRLLASWPPSCETGERVRVSPDTKHTSEVFGGGVLSGEEMDRPQPLSPEACPVAVISSNATESLPDELKGVGSTYDDLVTVKRQDSITDDDLAILIDQEEVTATAGTDKQSTTAAATAQ